MRPTRAPVTAGLAPRRVVDAPTMAISNAAGSRVSRETRQLLTAALIALVALWIFARIRFPGQPPVANPIPLLSQLGAPRFANLAAEIAELQGRLSSTWLAVPVSRGDDSEGGSGHLTAIRLDRDTAVTLLRSGDRLSNPDDLVASDRVTGVAVVRAHGASAGIDVPRWNGAALDAPRYVMSTVGTRGGVSLRPVLVGSLREAYSAWWPGAIWAVPDGTDLAPSAFVFTTSGELAGLVVREPIGLAIVPWDILLAEATRLRAKAGSQPVDVGIEVRPLTAALARATSATGGVVVSWVDPRGPAAKLVAVGDVIETLDAQPISHTREWDVASGRLSEGVATLGVRRRGQSMDVLVTLPGVSASSAAMSLGLRMRDVPGLGTSVVQVDIRSAASSAGLQEGDVITLAGSVRAPRASQIENAFRAARPGDAVLLAVTRGSTHLVMGLVK